MYVFQLNIVQIMQIEVELRHALTETGLYTPDEIEKHVQNGLNSKVQDLSDIINIKAILEK